MMSPHKPAGVRSGLSLLEVLVALSIFLTSFVMLSQLIKLSSDLAVNTQNQIQAARLCQSKMAEVIGGAVPLTSQSAVPFVEDPAWLWSLECEQSNYPGLWNVAVQVSRQQARGPQVVCTLSEMVLDPQIHGSLQDLPPGSSTSSDSSSSSSSPSSSGSTGTSAMGGN